jgi:2-polyprenyl-6-methoxyphenol hydroxylase-like FAD-dependent oxidoreductase
MDCPKIAVVGAGPGGLTLARILYQKGMDAIVFEREEQPSSRPQGGSLDMHEDTGQLALKYAGLMDAFKSIARYQDQEFRVYDKHGVLRAIETDTANGNRPEIDRGQLRQLLLDSVPASAIRWNHGLSAVEPQNNGTVDLLFENGLHENFDLVVGADGTWSRVRPVLSDAKPSYTGVTMYELGISDADVRHPELAEVVGRGLMFALGDSKAIGGHRDANAHLGIYAGMRVEESAVRNLGAEARRQLKPALLSYFADWSPQLQALIANAADSVAPRPIYTLLWVIVGNIDAASPSSGTRRT